VFGNRRQQGRQWTEATRLFLNNKTLFQEFVFLVDEFNQGPVGSWPQFCIPIEQRNQKAIVHRFAKIKKAASQFAGIIHRNKIKSGENKTKYMERCSLIFEPTHKQDEV
jgi:hypothetical protein